MPPLPLSKRTAALTRFAAATKNRSGKLSLAAMPCLDAIRQIGVTELTYCRWKKRYGGMGTDQFKELKQLHRNASEKRNKCHNVVVFSY